MENGLSKSEKDTRQDTSKQTRERSVATCAECNQVIKIDGKVAVCTNATCPLFFIPQKVKIIEADVVIEMAPPEDGEWMTQHDGPIKYSDMDHAHLLNTMHLLWAANFNGSWRRDQIVPILAWARYRGVQLTRTRTYKKLEDANKSLDSHRTPDGPNGAVAKVPKKALPQSTTATGATRYAANGSSAGEWS